MELHIKISNESQAHSYISTDVLCIVLEVNSDKPYLKPEESSASAVCLRESQQSCLNP